MTNVVNIKQYPDWLDQELWEDFKKCRQERKNPLTPTAEKRAIMKLERLREDGEDVTEVIERSINKNYDGLFPVPKKPEQGNTNDTDIIRRGKQLGINPKPGESMAEYNLRLLREAGHV